MPILKKSEKLQNMLYYVEDLMAVWILKPPKESSLMENLYLIFISEVLALTLTGSKTILFPETNAVITHVSHFLWLAPSELDEVKK